MGRHQGEVFVIDGDDLIKPTGKTESSRNPAGPQAVPPVEAGATVASTRATAATRGGPGRAAGAASLSLWVWGSGQWMNGDRDLAVLLFLWQILIAALHYFVASTWSALRRMAHVFFISEWELLLYAAALDFWLIFLLVFNVSQAYRSAERHRGRFHGFKRPCLAGLASIMVPGWGQILNGQLGKGLVFLFVFVTQAYLLAFYLCTPLYGIVADLDPARTLLRSLIQGGQVGLVVTAQTWFVSVYDAVLVARYTRNRPR
jgi:hypothetical protein